tara:strand:- start:82 stop:237 length:156 start_codon:yes stop_codon:yes gene_type:complete
MHIQYRENFSMTTTEKIAYAKKRIHELEELIEHWGKSEKNNQYNQFEKLNT